MTAQTGQPKKENKNKKKSKFKSEKTVPWSQIIFWFLFFLNNGTKLRQVKEKVILRS